MELRIIEWQEQGYHLMLVEAKRDRFHLLVSRDRREYAIYERFSAPNIEVARRNIQFSPYFYEAVPPAFLITREEAMAGETGIPDNVEALVRHMERVQLKDLKRSDGQNNLTLKTLQVCASCSHSKWQGGTLSCDRKKSECHSKRVRKWLEELKKLEVE